MSDLKRYFDDEMYYLRECGRQFAKDYPDVARMLEGVSANDRDPAVERLLEGFSFLTARVRQEMDREDIGLALDLVEMTRPALLQPLPSATLAEIQPPRNERSQRQVSRGMAIATGAIPALGYACQFACDDARPLSRTEISGVALVTGVDGYDCLEIKLERGENVPDGPEEMVLYVNGEPTFAWTLWYFLVKGLDARSAPCARPYCAESAQGGWETCRHYFAMEERFRMFALQVPAFKGQTSLLLRFSRKFPAHMAKAIQRDTLRNNVFPLLNRYLQGTEPVSMDQRHFEYRITPRIGRKQEILSLHEVRAGSHKEPGRFARVPAFVHLGEDETSGSTGYYRFETRTDRQGLSSGWIALGGLSGEIDTLSIDAFCCDGPLVREHVQAKDINVAKDPGLAGCAISALLRPTPMLRPPESQEREWQALGLLGAGLRSLADPSYLRRALSMWNWDSVGSKAFLVDCLRECAVDHTHSPQAGRLFPSLEVRIRFQDDKCQADSWDRLALYEVLGHILGQVFREQASLHTLVGLVFEIEPCRVSLSWAARSGLEAPL